METKYIYDQKSQETRDKMELFQPVKDHLLEKTQDFPGSPVVRTLWFCAGGTGSIFGQGTNTLHATWPKKKKKTKIPIAHITIIKDQMLSLLR